MPFSKAYLETYKGLPELLEKKHKQFNFQNHCYLRMALDHVFEAKWDTKINRPAYRQLSVSQKQNVVTILRRYLTEPHVVLRHHQESITYRNLCQKKQLKLSL